MRQLKSTTLNKWLVAKTLVDSTIAQAIETEKAASDTTLSLSLILLAPKILYKVKTKTPFSLFFSS